MRRIIAVLSLTTFAAICCSAQVTDAILEAGHRGDPKTWPFYGGNYSQDRYSDLNQINKGTVKTLKPAI